MNKFPCHWMAGLLRYILCLIIGAFHPSITQLQAREPPQKSRFDDVKMAQCRFVIVRGETSGAISQGLWGYILGYILAITQDYTNLLILFVILFEYAEVRKNFHLNQAIATSICSLFCILTSQLR